MKKYSKMTFAALSAIVLNFSCLAISHPPKHPADNRIRTHNNIHDRTLTPLSTEEQISLLKRAILRSDVFFVENILTGHIEKIGRRYFSTQGEIRFFVRMSDPQFEELQLFSLDDLGLPYHSNDSIHAKRKIFELITAKFYEVTNNKEQAIKTTASKVYHNLDSISVEELGRLIDLPPSPDSKKAFVKQFLNDAKQDNNIDAYNFIFFALDPTIGDISNSSFSMFKNQPWLLPFISEYLEQAHLNAGLDMPTILYFIKKAAFISYLEYLERTNRRGCFGIPLYFIKEVAPDLYNKNFLTLLEGGIIEDSQYSIDILLPRDNETSLPSDNRRLSSEYLNLALESFNTHFHENNSGSKHILSNIASYTDTSSDLKDVARTLASFTQEVRQEILKCIKKANRDLHDLLLEKLQSLGH